MNLNKIIITRLTEDQHRAAFALADAKGMSVSTMVRHLIISEAERRKSQTQNPAGNGSEAAASGVHSTLVHAQ